MNVLLYLAGVIAFVLGIYELVVRASNSSIAIIIVILAFITRLNSFAVGYKMNKYK
jgi:hypothetical protein